MKYLLILLVLTGCNNSPKFKKGDCVQYNWDTTCEKWQDHCKITTYKIVNVGKEHYQVLLYYSDMPHVYFLATDTFNQLDKLPKVECWVNFGDGEGDRVAEGMDGS